jgi:hypothetical protein
MNPFETFLIKLLFTTQNAPQDFISGIIEALNEDLKNKEPDAQRNVNILVEQATALQEPATLISTISLLGQLSELWRKNEKVQQQSAVIRKIVDIIDCDPSTPFSERIAVERIGNLAEQLKAI